MAYTYFSKTILILTILVITTAFTPINNQWTTPEQIPNYEDTSRPPFLIADLHNRIHSFNYESLSPTQNAIIYRTWSLDTGWTPPVDIILTGQGGGPQTLQGVVLDREENFHLIFNVSSMQGGNLYYSSAPLTRAANATGWSKPVLIGPDAGPQPFANLTLGLNDQLLVFFGAEINGDGLYLVTSENKGKNWSQPVALTLFSTVNYWAGAMRSLVDPDGTIHFVWSIISDAGVGEEVHYAKLNEEKNQFMDEALMARREGTDYSANWPDLIRSDDILILFYMDSFPATRYMRTSSDNGKSWSLPIQPFPYIGEYETTAMVKDSLGTIHLLLGNRTVDPEIHGMWYSQWLGSRWSALSAITYGPKTSSFDPSVPKATILNGNLIFVTWWNDTRSDQRNGAWYSYLQLDAPPLDNSDPISLTTNSQDGTVESTPQPLPSSTLMASTPTEELFNRNNANYLPASSVYWAIIPVIGLVIFFYGYRRRHV